MRNRSAVTSCKIIFGVGATFAVISAAGCGATESTCKELQRTCGCDDRKPCPGDGAAGKGGSSGSGAGGAGDVDGSDDASDVVREEGAAGSGGKGGAGGGPGSGGTAGITGAGGKAGAGGTAGTGGMRDDAATDAGAPDREVDGAGPTADVSLDTTADGGGDFDAVDEHDAAIEAGIDADATDIGPTCDVTKSPSVESCLIDELYGVFVSPLGNDLTGSGTRAAPFATFGKALQTAAPQLLRVYACDQGTGFAEQLDVPDGAKIFGGFECVDWTYATTRRAVVRAPTAPALAIRNAVTSVLMEDIEIDAPDATGVGASSVGALIDSSASVVLRRMKIVAGKGGGGTEGADGAKGMDAPDVAAAQVGSAGLCPAMVAAQLGGAWSQVSSCNSRGGVGGTATQGSDGSNGVAGTPRDNVAPPDVDNGGLKGAVGGDGISGSPGNPGNLGVPTPTMGMFTSSGYTPASAVPSATGGDGSVGQGGGGGGGSNATGMCIGASGGAGGMGGCGGKGGTGGAGGGASIAVISWTSELTLDTCELVSSAGGLGGKGGDGGAGGSGKAGAVGGEAFAGDGGMVVGKGGRGGTGGTGGLGGPGGGGTGGPSYALVYKAQAPVKTNVTLTPGAAGVGGPGGTSGPTTGSTGNAGQAAPEFPVP
jgi:hypothetical protein